MLPLGSSHHYNYHACPMPFIRALPMYAFKSWWSCPGHVLRVCPVLQGKHHFNLTVSFQPAHLSLSQESTSLGMISLGLVPTNEASPGCFPSRFHHQITLLSCSHCSQDQNQEILLCITFKGIIQLSSFRSCPPSHLVPIVCVCVCVYTLKYFVMG